MLQSDRAMRIICPTCASHYELEADKIGATGQLVRCAECREVWLVRLPDAPAAERPAMPAPSEPLDEPRADREPSAFKAASQAASGAIDFAAARVRLRRRTESPAAAEARRKGGTTLLSIGVIGALALGLAGSFRSVVVDWLPAVGPAYAALGLPAAPEALALREVHSVLSADGDTRTLTLEGSIANLGTRAIPVPNLTVVVRDKAETPLYSWTTIPPKNLLGRGETVAFRSRLTSPPATSHDVQVSFAEVRPAATHH